MKHIFLFLLIVGFGILTRAQTLYEVYNGADGKILKGLITRDVIVNDPSFSWFQQYQDGYRPDKEAVKLLMVKRQDLELLVFGGTWNQDSRFFLPKFFKMTDMACFPQNQITLVCLDPDHHDLDHLAEIMHINTIPTCIVLKKGREIGRVTISQKSTGWDKAIADILNSRP
jgi:hypothetical protein